MGVKRDFSRETILKISNMIVENMNDSDGFFEQWGDFFDDIWHVDWDVDEHLGDIEEFQKHEIDNNNIDIDMFNRILQRVHGTDTCYSGMLEQERICQQGFVDEIYKMSAMISPKAILASKEEYDRVLNSITEDFEDTKKTSKKEKDRIYDLFKQMREDAEYENGWSWERFDDEAIGGVKSILKELIADAYIATGSPEGATMANDAVDTWFNFIFDDLSNMREKYQKEGEDGTDKIVFVIQILKMFKDALELDDAVDMKKTLTDDELKLSDDMEDLEKKIDGIPTSETGKIRTNEDTFEKSYEDMMKKRANESSLNSIDVEALKHSTIGDFTYNPKTGDVSRMKGGGHSQSNIDFLEANGIEYNIVKEYENGVRIGNVPKHKTPSKRTGTGQAWFPETWTDDKIKAAGEYIANLPENSELPDGVVSFGTYDNVRVGIIKTDGKVGTIFPDADLQP